MLAAPTITGQIDPCSIEVPQRAFDRHYTFRITLPTESETYPTISTMPLPFTCWKKQQQTMGLQITFAVKQNTQKIFFAAQLQFPVFSTKKQQNFLSPASCLCAQRLSFQWQNAAEETLYTTSIFDVELGRDLHRSVFAMPLKHYATECPERQIICSLQFKQVQQTEDLFSICENTET